MIILQKQLAEYYHCSLNNKHLAGKFKCSTWITWLDWNGGLCTLALPFSVLQAFNGNRGGRDGANFPVCSSSSLLVTGSWMSHRPLALLVHALATATQPTRPPKLLPEEKSIQHDSVGNNGFVI